MIWCDESIKHGDYYSNFYGGVLVSSKHIEEINEALNNEKQKLHLFQEIKWSKITENYKNKYIDIINLFFNFVAQGKIKVRIMFTDNTRKPRNLTPEQKENEYYLLYYQFIKHIFGLTRVDFEDEILLRIYFDNLPHTKEKASEFKGFIYGLKRHFLSSNIILKRENIAEIDSKQHNILQCLDIVLGSMAFRLNKQHKYIEPGKRRRGKRTVAKEEVYKVINRRIQEIYPNSIFNIGVTTGSKGWENPIWNMPYRHWVFEAKNSEYIGGR
jgi:hypothetical protein